jgi:hypothetical protein
MLSKYSGSYAKMRCKITKFLNTIRNYFKGNLERRGECRIMNAEL